MGDEEAFDKGAENVWVREAGKRKGEWMNRNSEKK
jgi:hypothetical protein